MKLGIQPAGWERAGLVLGEQKDVALTLASRLEIRFTESKGSLG